MTHSVDNSDFAIHNRKEIAFILNDLVKDRTAVNLKTSDGESLLTLVLKVSAEEDYVYLDTGTDDRINDKIIQSKKVNFSTQANIEVRWHSTHLHRVSLPDGDVFSMAFPAVVERIQRREYFRLKTPQGSNALICKIPVEADIIEAILVDMSAGDQNQERRIITTHWHGIREFEQGSQQCHSAPYGRARERATQQNMMMNLRGEYTVLGRSSLFLTISFLCLTNLMVEVLQKV